MTTPLSIRIERLTAMADGVQAGVYGADKVEVREDDLRALISAHAENESAMATIRGAGGDAPASSTRATSPRSSPSSCRNSGTRRA